MFISSVQSEFAQERQFLSDYITSDALLGKFFDPFIFDNVLTVNYNVSSGYSNTLAHRDYTSNGSIQVILFKDRLEIWNPGSLPYGLTTAKHRKPHSSIPANPLLAEPMYLAGFIERMGTGTGDIIRLCDEAGLKKAREFLQEEIFKTILWRKNTDALATVEVSGGVNDILVLIENNPGINVSTLKSHLNIPQRTIERWINQLKKENKIEFKGAPKTGGYYSLIV